jgi:predicted phosphate transport protein (TIGR00153 family)
MQRARFRYQINSSPAWLRRAMPLVSGFRPKLQVHLGHPAEIGKKWPKGYILLTLPRQMVLSRYCLISVPRVFLTDHPLAIFTIFSRKERSTMSMLSNSPLAGLLRGSPFTAIQRHMSVVFSCVCYIPPLFDAVYREDSEQTLEFAEKIDSLETEADKLKSAFRLRMPKSLFLPVDRKDLLSLISDQDRIADSAEDIGKIFLYRHMVVPEGIKELLDELLEGTMEISAAAREMIERLDELLEVGFSGKEIDRVSTMIANVRKSEHNIDDIVHRIRKKLFSIETELDPVSVMFWYKIIELLGMISNQAENLADRLLLFLSK